MKIDVNVLLSDEFIAFSNKIAAIHNEKKKKKQELKAFYDKIQLELAALDDQAKATALEFDEWKKQFTKEEKEEADAAE
jgi:hypothetical protein